MKTYGRVPNDVGFGRGSYCLPAISIFLASSLRANSTPNTSVAAKSRRDGQYCMYPDIIKGEAHGRNSP